MRSFFGCDCRWALMVYSSVYGSIFNLISHNENCWKLFFSLTLFVSSILFLNIYFCFNLEYLTHECKCDKLNDTPEITGSFLWMLWNVIDSLELRKLFSLLADILTRNINGNHFFQLKYATITPKTCINLSTFFYWSFYVQMLFLWHG